ncbi:MAG TPA: FHA domain-containing protein [Solirubrobacteraceae bacterium]
METLSSGTITGAGSFRCRHCDYVLTLLGSDTLSDCPRCGGEDFARASLFRAGRLEEERSRREEMPTGRRVGWDSERDDRPVGGVRNQDEDTLTAHRLPGAIPELKRDAMLLAAREQVERPGEYLVYEESGEWRTVALTREWTRIGRSLAADVRFDDTTVSRRHALIVRQPDGVRVLDDRSLNGVFVNGARIEGRALKDGDEILVGRYRLSFLSVPSAPDA